MHSLVAKTHVGKSIKKRSICDQSINLHGDLLLLSLDFVSPYPGHTVKTVAAFECTEA